MKVLFLTRALPYPANNGYKKRNFYLIKELARRGVDIVLICPDSVNYIQPLKNYCKEIKVVKIKKAQNKFLGLLSNLFSSLPFSVKTRISPELKREIKQYLEDNPVDVVICDSIYRSLNIPLDNKHYKILYEHNIESTIIKRYFLNERNVFKKLFALIEYRKFENFQKKMWKKFNCCIVCSPVDKNIVMQKVKGINIFIINNGVDSSYFTADSYPLFKNSLLYTGQIGWYPNEDALIHFIKKIYPIIKKEEPLINFWIVGDSPSKRLQQLAKKDMSIILTGFVDDVRPYMGEAVVYVVPLRIGSGTRLKILEALSMKKAIVSTGIGCEGLEVKDNKHLLIRDDPEEFAGAVIELLRDDKLRKELGENGRKLIEEKYDWQVVFKNLDEILDAAYERNLTNDDNDY